jgi:preprotein translocase subunit YajC
MLNSLAAVVAADSKDSGGAASFVPLLLIGLIFVAMYFLMIRPQRRRLREAQTMQRSIGEGDEVLTTSGVYGFVTAIDGDVMWLEIAENVEIRIAKGAISKVIDQAETSTDDADDSADDDANADS